VAFWPHQHTNEDMDLMVTPRHNVEEKFEAMWGDGSGGGVHRRKTSGEVEVARDGARPVCRFAIYISRKVNQRLSGIPKENKWRRPELKHEERNFKSN
jgi:hypothetical protein